MAINTQKFIKMEFYFSYCLKEFNKKTQLFSFSMKPIKKKVKQI